MLPTRTWHVNKILVYAGLSTLLLISLSLRFTNLSYSEFQDDEKKAQIRLLKGETLDQFFLRQRKGPMQFIVASIPTAIYNPKVEVNEFAIRFPFTLANLISVGVLYGLILKNTKSHIAALLTSTVYSVNGFVVGFSRIAQYQSLNLLFSFLALYFYSDLKLRISNFRLPVFLGTLFVSLSFLSHWDTVFIAVPVIYFLLSFILRKDVKVKEKLVCLVVVLVTLGLLVLPFLILYVLNMSANQTGNVDYLFKRVGLEGSSFARHKYIFELYNPEITLWLCLTGILLAIAFLKKTWMYILWFVMDLLLIKFFMVTPKTHIYNYVIPAVITSTLGIYYFYKWVITKFGPLRTVFLLAYLAITGLLFYQSFLIFVDHKKEYPFDEKKVLWHENPVFRDEEIITFGFPHNRNWKLIDKYIDPKCRYITNESKGISQIYVKADYGTETSCYYIVYIKRPFYTKTQDATYAGVNDSKMVYKYVKNNETLVKVYRMK